MVHTRIFAVVALLLAALPAAAGGDEPYTLQPGDTLFVSVWKEEELSRELVVLPDGTISFPLAGSLSVTGLTPAEAEAELAKKLGKYIPDAEVSVPKTRGRLTGCPEVSDADEGDPSRNLQT